MRLRKLDGLNHHAEGPSGRGRQHHFGTEKAHKLAPLHAELLGHGHDERIALSRAHHGETDAGVAARCLDDRLSGLQLTRLLRGLDHAERQAVLHRSQGIECLDLDEQVDAGRRQAVDPDDGRVADRSENAAELCHLLPRG